MPTTKEILINSIKTLVEKYRAGELTANDKFEFGSCIYTMKELELLVDKENEGENHA